VVEALFRLDEILSQKPCLILTDPNDFEIFLKLKRFATASKGYGATGWRDRSSVAASNPASENQPSFQPRSL
jgi:hypothetical protein